MERGERSGERSVERSVERGGRGGISMDGRCVVPIPESRPGAQCQIAPAIPGLI